MINKIKLSGVEYVIEEVTDLFERRAIFGEFIPYRSKILLDKNLNEDMKFNTLMHEVVHLILNNMNCNVLSENEEFVTNLANNLIIVMPQIYNKDIK